MTDELYMKVQPLPQGTFEGVTIVNPVSHRRRRVFVKLADGRVFVVGFAAGHRVDLSCSFESNDEERRAYRKLADIDAKQFNKAVKAARQKAKEADVVYELESLNKRAKAVGYQLVPLHEAPSAPKRKTKKVAL